MKHLKKIGFCALALLMSVLVSAQIVGGRQVYQFLTLPSSARITALGGKLLSVQDDDVASAMFAPSLLQASASNVVSFNHHFHFASIRNGYVAYARHSEKLRLTWQASVQYANYGKFDATDEYGVQNGTFSAADYSFLLGAAKKLTDHLSVGINLKLITSQLESYRSSGLATDASCTYNDPESSLCATLAVQNLGTQLTTYVRGGQREALPFDVQFGVSKKLKHTPFRFSLTAHHLHQWNIRYADPDDAQAVVFLGDNAPSGSATSEWTDNLFRHLNFGAEILLGKKENLQLRFGYNHLRRRELSVENLKGLAGFSIGGGIKISRLRIDYGRAFYHLAGSTNQLSVSTNLKDFGLK